MSIYGSNYKAAHLQGRNINEFYKFLVGDQV